MYFQLLSFLWIFSIIVSLTGFLRRVCWRRFRHRGNLSQRWWGFLTTCCCDGKNLISCSGRSLHGLKQAPRAWFAMFSSTITQLGFTSNSHNSSLITRLTCYDIVLLLLYVDDMIITCDFPQAIYDLQNYLRKHFEMKDLEALNYFLIFLLDL